MVLMKYELIMFMKCSLENVFLILTSKLLIICKYINKYLKNPIFRKFNSHIVCEKFINSGEDISLYIQIPILSLN